MRHLQGETFGQRYGIDPSGLVLWLDQSDPRSYGDLSNWYDLSGQGNHGSQAVGANQPAITGAVGLAGNCRDFDGGNDYIDLGNDVALTPSTGDFSAVVWLNPLGANAIISRRNTGAGGTVEGWHCGIAGDKFNVLLEEANGDYKNYIGTDTGLLDGTWHQVSFTWSNANDDLILYVDGVVEGLNKDNDDVLTGDDISPATDLNIGRRPDNAQHIEAEISNAIIFSKVLTTAEIQRMYLVDKPRYGGF